MKEDQAKTRRIAFIRRMLLVVILVAVIFLARFGQIMLAGRAFGVNLRERTQVMYGQENLVVAPRGTIYDVGGNPIALDADAYTMYAVLTPKWTDAEAEPEHVENKEATAQALAKHIDMSAEDILKTLSQEGVDQVQFGNAGQNLSYAQMAAIQAENLQGIKFSETPSRLYPNQVFASHLIGYADFKQAADKIDSRLFGELGLELSRDENLAGENGYQTANKKTGNKTIVKEAQEGQDIYTTLDSRLQTYLETLVNQVDDKYQPKKLTAMLVEPTTGKIVAATQRPTFNPQTREGLEDMWQNLLVEDSYEPGSTFKILTVAAAVEEGIFDPNAYYQSGSIEIDGSVISDYNKVGWGAITQLEGLARSSNVLTVELVQAMGYDTWKNYMYEFGLLQKPNSGFANETAGSMNYEVEFEKASTSFGQGIRLSPWQMVQALTAVANDGQMMALQIIDRYEDQDGQIQVVKPEQKNQPISAETAQKTRQFLTEVVNSEHGSGRSYAIEGVDLAVKTGTAEIFDEDAQQYLAGGNNYLFSMAGMAPADNPQYIMYITLQQPIEGTGVYPNQMIAEIFVPLMERALAYNAVGNELEHQQEVLPDFSGQSVLSAQSRLNELGFLKTRRIGQGDQVIAQSPAGGESLASNQTVILITDYDGLAPDFSGLTRSEAQRLANSLGIEVRLEGEGIVVGQSIAAGNPLAQDQPLVLQLQQA
ncbi:penicillin-binding protein [Aerococcus urinaehominis]|uniref:Penicillin-binding protein n=1 Tax=Aerococcus urinaehominis TaxID=128944 RepID=A0A0X8FLS0_9LACT|nr:penicillin-binding transpeptidase domain-containing protein [Aerococcus urinaehominis]AMB99658.1 penicillin-binding protein [Aerococcus urinaehominis]SDL89258.1 penicillin-binding protein 2B [Aerococcus urinaehominis]